MTPQAWDSEALGFETRSLHREEIDRLVSPADGPALQAAFAEAIQAFAAQGLPWSHGRERIVFHRGRTVAKLPLSMGGVHANATERSQYRRTLAGQAYCPVAACRVRHDPEGIPILIMRTVIPVPSTQDLPDWSLSVDCQQVGMDLRGRLVAYDL